MTMQKRDILNVVASFTPMERAIFSRRYVCGEGSERTCTALQISAQEYSNLRLSCLRKLRGLPPTNEVSHRGEPVAA